MGIFNALKYLDVRYLSKKMAADADVKANLAKAAVYVHAKSDEFIKNCREARVKLKDIPGTNYKLGLLHMRRGNISDAIMRFRMVTFLMPGKIEAYYNLGRCLVLAGEDDNAVKQFEKVVEMDANFSDAAYMLEKLKNPSKIKSVPLAVIREKCDILAELCEEENANEGYIASNTLVNIALNHIKDKNPSLEVLDLGSGSGTCGKILKKKEVVKSITGVDLSGRRIKTASALKLAGQNIYNKLEEKEIRAFLSENNNRYDMILADMAFYYLGSLTDIAELLKKSAKPAAIVAFITAKNEENDEFSFDIASDSFTYSEKYVKEQFAKAGFELLEAKNIALYHNEGSEVEEQGTIFVYKI